MNIQDRRQKNIDIFLDTKDWCAIDLELNAAIDASRRGTKVFGPGPMTTSAQMLVRFHDAARVIVTENRTLQAACQYGNVDTPTVKGSGILR